MNSILNIQHIEMSYDAQPVIKDLSLNLKEGQIGCLLASPVAARRQYFEPLPA